MRRLRRCTWNGLVLAALVGLALLLAAPVAAQYDPWPVSVEFSLGHGAGSTDGEYRDNGGGPAVDLLLGVRLRSTDRGAWVTAVSTSAQGPLAHTDDCLVAADGGCVPWFPNFGTIALLGGWETSSAALRVLTGPALVTDSGTWPKSRSAWVLRFDAAQRWFGRISMLASARGSWVPSYEGDRFLLGALALGLRIR